MKNYNTSNRKELFETILQLFFVFVIVGFCFKIMLPFLMPILWAVILAIAFYPLFNFLQRIFKGRKTLAAILITIVLLVYFYSL